jgi:5-methylcytosine-specific restriction endonuclease McrA
LLHALSSLVAQDRATTADVLAHMAEVDARRLYLPAGYASVFAYCLEALHLSEDVTCKRIQAARAARAHPALFAAVADGRLHLAAVCLLAPHLDARNADELIAAAIHHSKAEVERMLAERFVVPVQQVIVPVASAPTGEPAPGQVELRPPVPSAAAIAPPSSAPPPVEPRLVVRLALPLSTQDKLRRAQALLSHAVPSGDAAEIVDRALDALIEQLERRKFAKSGMPRAPHTRPPTARRTIPAHVKRAVWVRDDGCCAFVGDDGRRCTTRSHLEFDHVDPVARGGRASVDRVRLLCRAHNQFEAERVYGAGFMRRKRAEARAGHAGRSTWPGAGDHGGGIAPG